MADDYFDAFDGERLSAGANENASHVQSKPSMDDFDPFSSSVKTAEFPTSHNVKIISHPSSAHQNDPFSPSNLQSLPIYPQVNQPLDFASPPIGVYPPPAQPSNVITFGQAIPAQGQKECSIESDDPFNPNGFGACFEDMSSLNDQTPNVKNENMFDEMFSEKFTHLDMGPIEKDELKSTKEIRAAKELSDDEDGDHSDAELELQTEGDRYTIEFPHETKLGMLLEKSEEKHGEIYVERTIVKMVIDGGAAETRGVKVGSKLLRVNGIDVVGAPYLKTLDHVRTLPRPLTIEFESVGYVEDSSQGYCLIRKAPGYSAPTSFGVWKPAYFVIGGAVARPHVLQIYNSKLEYEQVVVAMFQHRSVKSIRYKAYSLTKQFKVSRIQEKNYKTMKKTVKFLSLKNPESKTKVLKIGTDDNPHVIEQVHGILRKFCSDLTYFKNPI